MSEILESAAAWWEFFFPTPLTPEQRIDRAYESVKVQENRLRKEEWMTKARLERVDQALTKASKTRNKTDIECAAREKISVENQRNEVQSQMREMQATKEDVMRMKTDQTRAKVLLEVMAATNQLTVDPAVATQIIYGFQRASVVRDATNELVNEAMEARREDVAEAQAEQAEADSARIEQLTSETWERANGELLQELPHINVSGRVPPVASGPAKELELSNRDDMRQLNAFLASK